MWKAKQEFLWYKKEDTIKDGDLQHCEKWSKDLLVYEVKEDESPIIIADEKKEEEPKKESLIEKVKDVIDDLADDGKLNKSNRKKPGRKKK